MANIPEKDLKCVKAFSSLSTAISEMSDQVNEFVNIGGAKLINSALENASTEIKYIIYTKIDSEFECDTYMREFDTSVFKEIHESQTYIENEISFKFVIYGNKNLMRDEDGVFPSRIVDLIPAEKK